MSTSRRGLAATVAGLALASVPACALDLKPFEDATFHAAQAAGKAILIDVSASWCPICKVQRPILSELLTKHPMEGYLAFELDYDSRKDVLRRLKVYQPGTLVIFRGKSEKGRATDQTNGAVIDALLRRAL